MVLDLNMGVEVVGAETVREPDGLRLQPQPLPGPRAAAQAVALSRVLRAAQDAAGYGAASAFAAARAELRAAQGVDLDHLVITDPDLGDLPDDVPRDGARSAHRGAGTTRSSTTCPRAVPHLRETLMPAP